MIKVTSTEAVRHLGDYLARVKYRGETFLLTRNEEKVAQLGPVGGSHTVSWGELKKTLDGLPYDPAFADDLEKVNRADRILENPWD